RLPFATYSQRFWVRTDLIQQSGADSLSVTSGNLAPPSLGTLATIATIEDGVSLSLPGEIRLSLGTTVLVAARVAPGQNPSTREPVVQFSASHITLSGATTVPANPTASNVRGSLSFTADTIDIDGKFNFNNIKTLNLSASGDVRLFGSASIFTDPVT